MFRLLADLLGLLPEPPKTGGREAGLMSVTVTTLFSIEAIVSGILWGREYFDMQWPMLAIMWPGAFAIFAMSFGLQSKEASKRFDDRPHWRASRRFRDDNSDRPVEDMSGGEAQG
ncbi:MAG: hypothetical protein AAGI12_16015 [Pseudomonadota bacterium]